MLFAALGAIAAIWLSLCSALDFDAGARATLAVWVGVAALGLAPVGIWFRPARSAVGVLGALFAMVCLFAPPSTIGALANYVASASVLIVAGIAPEPASDIVAPAARRAPESVRLVAHDGDGHDGDGLDKDTVRLIAAA
jgi:hypothetical protein